MSDKRAAWKKRLSDFPEYFVFLGFIVLLWAPWTILLRTDRNLAARRQIGGFSAPFAAFIGPQELSDFLNDPAYPHDPPPSQDADSFIQPDWLQPPTLAAGFLISPPVPSAPPRIPLGRTESSDWTPASFQVPSYRLPRVSFPLDLAPQTNGVWFLDIPDDISLDEAELREFTTRAIDRVDAAADLLFDSRGLVESVLLPPEMTAFTPEERSQLDRILHRANRLSETNTPVRIRWYWRK